MTRHVLLQRLGRRRPIEMSSRVESHGPLIDEEDLEEFLVTTSPVNGAELNEILERAIGFTIQSRNQSLEISFISLSAALESVLTFFRRQNEYDILGTKRFSELERDLKKWLKQHPTLANEPAKRGLIYEKVPELNRFPFSYVFKKFCAHHSLDLTDLWPVVGKHAEWPLTEIRHRLVHGDPFVSRPAEAMACASAHLGWVVERMILCVIGWPIERSNVRPDYLIKNCGAYQSWEAKRAMFG